jgi:hypothetical protein
MSLHELRARAEYLVILAAFSIDAIASGSASYVHIVTVKEARKEHYRKL